MEASVLGEIKQEFVNEAPGWLGCTVVHGRNNEPKAIPVAPGARIFLSREEQILTSRAYKDDESSPFKNGLVAVAAPGKVRDDIYVPFDADTVASEDANSNGNAAEAAPAPPEITGVEPQPAGDAAVGQKAKDEIAGTPAAQETKAATPPPAPILPTAKQGPSVPKPLGTP